MTIITMDKKNMNVTVIKQAKTYKIYLLIVFKLLIIGLFPSGCKSAAASLYIKEMARIFKAGNTAIIIMIVTPTIPIAFFNNSAADNTVSAASVNVLPITGIKLPVMNLVVFKATPS